MLFPWTEVAPIKKLLKKNTLVFLHWSLKTNIMQSSGTQKRKIKNTVYKQRNVVNVRFSSDYIEHVNL